MQKILIPLVIFSLLAFILPVVFPAAAHQVQALIDDYLFPLIADWKDDGEFHGVDYGAAVSSAGDINNDGFDDVIIGAQRYLIDGYRFGAAFVYLGSSGGLSRNSHQILTNNNAGSLFGGSVSVAGDVNGDGYSDVIIGSPNYKDPLSDEPRGSVYLYYGSAGGLSLSPDWSLIGSVKDGQFGFSVSGAGDINRDGFDDILIGANHFSNGETNEGKVFLFYGSASGLSSEPDWSFESNQSGAQAGFAIAQLGDINGDLIDDFAVSTPNFDCESHNECGIVWVFVGSVDSAGLPSTPFWSTTGRQTGEYFGSSVAGAGDVNKDGYRDLIIGARGYDEDLVDIGAAYLFTNSASGFGTTAAWQVHSSQAFSGFGTSVSGLGDVNLDGYDDVAVGANRYSEGQNLEGVVFVYRGSPIGLEISPQWHVGGDKAEASFGYSIANAGDVNQDGKNDLLVGAPDYKRDEKTVIGQASLYHGMKAGEEIFYFHYLPMLVNGE